ncbi:Gamma-glutamylcyclotransferase [Holothuria leucospilota]|uniref:gamma-glutamylcyclotransferase n=1 Tax=Holothuria leucospilota TaxID=206669 RepID=A0A9Q1CAP3_HOLLE|nr:Gamma-glutamylcyclotransferase [Holothuria leucospilota]
MDCVNNSKGYFQYFSFGSNLNSIRIHLDNPSAVKIGVGKLKDYKLFFCSKKNRQGDPMWTGGTANIIENAGEEVWGVVWNIDMEAKSNLDRINHLILDLLFFQFNHY